MPGKGGRPRSCHCGVCAKCKRADYMREWWARKTPDERRELVSRRDPAAVREQDRRKMAKRRAAARPDFVAKQRARAAVATAIRSGRLKRQPCEVGDGCGGRVEAHHDDYSQALEVRWLCRRHHVDLHRAAA